MSEPLHVQVARALGCKLEPIQVAHPVYPMKIEGPIVGVRCGCSSKRGHGTWVSDYDGSEEYHASEILRYDTDWSATGPLIEKYGIALDTEWNMTEPPTLHGWRARVSDVKRFQVLSSKEYGYGKTPLEAVCYLLLKLAAEGKLAA